MASYKSVMMNRSMKLCQIIKIFRIIHKINIHETIIMDGKWKNKKENYEQSNQAGRSWVEKGSHYRTIFGRECLEKK